MNKIYTGLFLLIIFSFFAHSTIYGESNTLNYLTNSNNSLNSLPIKGKVLDSKTGEPIIGATVAIKGTTTGTISDYDGNFAISVQNADVILVFSFVGYIKQEITAGNNQKEIIVRLKEETKELDDVVVIGYGTQKKVDLMGAVSTIKSNDIASVPVPDVTKAIQGRAAGVTVTSNSGSPGSAMSIKIRGTGTVNNTDPLYVVDGFIVESISFLNPEDIKDFQVLKDASSAAIYGARAANGVVVITTKKGEKGVHVSFSSYWGVSQFWKKPDLLDKVGFKKLYESVYKSPLVISKADSIIYNEYAVNNWLDYIIQSGSTQKYNLQVTGGDEKNTYLVSGSWNSDNGIVQKTGFNKGDVRINIDNKLSDQITLRSNFQATLSNRKMVQEGEFNVFQYALREPTVNPMFDMSNLKMGGVNGDSIVSFNKVYNWNPYTRMYGTDFKSKTSGYLGNFELFIKFNDHLTNSTRAGFDFEYFSESDFSGENFQPYAYFDGGNNIGIKYDQNAVQQTDNNKSKWQIENITTFNKKFKKSTVTIIGGVSFEGYSETQTFAGRAMAPDFSSYFDALNATFVNPQISGYGSGWRSVGIPFRFDYNYAEKYLFQFNFRADASSIFAKDKRWGEFPSVSLGWKLKEEPFLKDVDWITQLKIRGNWGLSGNNRISQYATRTMINTDPSFYYVLGQQPFYRQGWTSSGIGNPNIVWENTDSKNAGIDLSLFKGSLSGTVEVFNKTTSNMLLQLPVVLSSGMTDAPWQNAGKVRNLGYEITASYKKSYGDFNFEVSTNFTQIFNRIISLGSANAPILGGYQPGNSEALSSTYLTMTAVGHAIGEFYGYKIDRSLHANGIWHTDDMANLNGKPLPVSYKKIMTGDFIFKDINGDNKIDENDKTFLGSPLPDFTYGFNINLQYKIVDLTMFFQGVQGNKIFNVERYYLNAFHYGGPRPSSSVFSNDNNMASDVPANSWTTTNQDAIYPIIKNQVDNNNNYRVSDFYIEDGSYLRLKTVQLGVNIPDKICKPLKISRFRLYASVYNLLTFTKYSGMDPEIGDMVNTGSVGNANTTTNNTSMGIDLGTFPQARTFTFGLLVDF
jgi:TonB-dependent starch-binding outer membrane protein SusC